MGASMDDLQALARLANALRPWLGELVIVGGWAHRLYRMLPNVPTLAYQPLRTRDADVAFSASNSLAGNMGAALKAAGFREELAGENTPPVTWYRLGGDDQGFYAEFLAPLVGSGTKRDGTDDATLTKAGVTAQKLRHVDLLLTSPWTIDFGCQWCRANRNTSSATNPQSDELHRAEAVDPCTTTPGEARAGRAVRSRHAGLVRRPA